MHTCMVPLLIASDPLSQRNERCRQANHVHDRRVLHVITLQSAQECQAKHASKSCKKFLTKRSCQSHHSSSTNLSEVASAMAILLSSDSFEVVTVMLLKMLLVVLRARIRFWRVRETIACFQISGAFSPYLSVPCACTSLMSVALTAQYKDAVRYP